MGSAAVLVSLSEWEVGKLRADSARSSFVIRVGGLGEVAAYSGGGSKGLLGPEGRKPPSVTP